ncbi:alcohol dehydrogenase catalytic domain-containing protein [Sphingomonas sanxanigenens]
MDGLELRSRIEADGLLEITLETVEIPAPGPRDLLIRVQAAPINPSDLGLLFGAADMATMRAAGTPERPILRAQVPDARIESMAGRWGLSMPVGIEGAGAVIDAGAEVAHLIGRTVATAGGGMYAEYRVLPADACLVLPEGTDAVDGASSFVNPMTALGMVETMRREGHSALVHTAAASNLGQMLVKLCQADGVPLVNIVRKPEQEELLRSLGAEYICDSSSINFRDKLTEALVATGATIAFDAIGGGRLASDILHCMEVAIGRRQTGAYSRYGSDVRKQVYMYGMLDTSPVTINRSFGFGWSVGGWLLTPFLKAIGAEATQALRQRVADNLTTIFASTYAGRLSLQEALQPDHVAVYGRRSTGEKFLIDPSKG